MINDALLVLIFDTEIKAAVFQLSGDKAPGPASFSGLFISGIGILLAAHYVVLFVVFMNQATCFER